MPVEVPPGWINPLLDEAEQRLEYLCDALTPYLGKSKAYEVCQAILTRADEYGRDRLLIQPEDISDILARITG